MEKHFDIKKKKEWLSNTILTTLLSILVIIGFSYRVFAKEEKITITHQLGSAVVSKNPKTIVVFDYATLDSLDQMGIEITGLPKSSLPKYLEKYKDRKYVDVGTLFEPNFELIYELQPDIIFISTRQSEQYSELQKIAPTVYLPIDTNDYLGSFANNLQLLGSIFDKETFVEKELALIGETVKQLNQKVTSSGKNALVIMANDGALSVYGRGSRFDVVYNEFGFLPADTDIQVANHGQNISFEYIAKINPNYMFVIDRAATVGGSITAQQVLDNAIVKRSDAYKNNRIIYLNSQVWYVASGGLQGTKIMIQDIFNAFQ